MTQPIIRQQESSFDQIESVYSWNSNVTENIKFCLS